MSLVVREPGLQSLLVDFGRERGRALGVGVGGAADRAALSLGNALVGNPPAAVALEFSLLGPTVEALHPTACVIFGAPFQSTVNGQPLAPGTTFQLAPGDVLRVGGTATGARGYLCVAGGFESPEVLGSRSALEPLRAEDVLSCGPSRTEPRGLPFAWVDAEENSSLAPPRRESRKDNPPPGPLPAGRGSNSEIALRASDSEGSLLPLPFREGGPGGVGLRVLDGPQRNWFTDDLFFTQTYTVLPASNRMGIRLKGAPVAREPGELVSEPVAPGAVQVTNDGLPIVLGVDGQTIGGYPKVAHVIRADLDRLAQLRPGDRVRFVRVLSAEAEAAAHTRAEFLRAWLTRLRIAERRPVVG